MFLVTGPMNARETRGDLTWKINSPAASLPFKGQVTEQTTVKGSIHRLLLILYSFAKDELEY